MGMLWFAWNKRQTRVVLPMTHCLQKDGPFLAGEVRLDLVRDDAMWPHTFGLAGGGAAVAL